METKTIYLQISQNSLSTFWVANQVSITIIIGTFISHQL